MPKYSLTVILLSIAVGIHQNLDAQIIDPDKKLAIDSTGPDAFKYFKSQKDLIDIVYGILHMNADHRIDSTGTKNTNVYVSAAPIVEYTIATGFSPGIAGNIAFKTNAKVETNTSSILGAVKYTTKKQFLLPIQSSIWTKGNKFNFLGDLRFLNYPQDTYGFGSLTSLSDKYIVNYKYLRFYEFVLKNIRKNLYAGIGYQLDYHWEIRELGLAPGRVTDFQKYGFSQSSTSSGIAFQMVYDSRENAINPEGGKFYANLQFHQDSKLLGASNNWNSLLIDVRKYIKMPHKNVMAFWFYGVFTLSGNPPYLDLTGTGMDNLNNTGRGYEQGRFIGKKMVDLEAEYRFGLSKNGLIGAVIFANAASVSELQSNQFAAVQPGVGIGLRIKFNKFSRTNACIDYGVGTRGSRGFVGNLGEVF
ncbi:MAG: hypothetical protein JST58_00795 [Bacteroidetes bacterium]|nr:hypothetical protein [Bacteroidota bacterium]